MLSTWPKTFHCNVLLNHFGGYQVLSRVVYSSATVKAWNFSKKNIPFLVKLEPYTINLCAIPYNEVKGPSYRVKLRLKMLTGPQPLARASKDGCLAWVIEHSPSAYVLTNMNFNIRDEINTKNEGGKEPVSHTGKNSGPCQWYHSFISKGLRCPNVCLRQASYEVQQIHVCLILV